MWPAATYVRAELLMPIPDRLKNIVSCYKYPAGLCLLTIFMLAVMEYRHPYFFLQDDNRTYFLPSYLHNFRAVTGGEIPLYNFHQYLGTPVSILAAAFYPLNYVALGLSKIVLGHYFGAMECIALLHLLIAVTGFYHFMRFFELDEVSCCFGAITWTFCGVVITVGNSWIWILGYAAYLPWIFLYSLKQIHRFESSDFIVLVVLRVLLFLLGYPQFFAYTALFELLTIASLSALQQRSTTTDNERWPSAGNGLQPYRRPGISAALFYFAAGYVVAAIVVLPLILPTLHQLSISATRNQILSWQEYVAFSYNVTYWLRGLFTPFADMDYKLFGEQQFISHIGYLGIVFVVVALATIKNDDRGRYVAVFSVLALISLLWAGNIVLAKIFYHVPIFNRFRFPFKLAFFTSFYLVIVSTFGFSAMFTKLRTSRGLCHKNLVVVVSVLLILQGANLLFMHAAWPQHRFASHSDNVPFAEPLQSVLGNGRIVSAGPDVIWDGEVAMPGFTAPLLGYNYATLWDLYHFGGYEDLLSEKNSNATFGVKNSSVFNVAAGVPLDFQSDVPLEYFRIWGVKWYIVDNKITLRNSGGLVQFHQDSFRNVLYDPAARPIAYWSDRQGDDAIKLKFRTNSVEIMTERVSDGKLTINVLHNPFFVATIDGRKATVTETAAAQLLLEVPAGNHKIIVKYADRLFYYGAVISLGFIGAIFAYGFLRKYTRHKQRHGQAA